MNKPKNPVAKFAHKFNKAVKFKDKKRELKKKGTPFNKHDVEYRSGDNT